MKIISVRHGFASDHSSTSYEFLALDRPLGKVARAAVSSLSRRANPTRRRVSFIYHADGYDIPGGWLPLMRDYYDVMYSESYDWWHLALAFHLPPERQDEIAKYDFENRDNLGVETEFYEDRAIVNIYCRLQPFGPYYLEDDWDSGEDEEESEEDDTLQDEIIAELNNPLLQLLAKIRKQLIEGDYRVLYEVWNIYGAPEYDDEEDEEGEGWPKPPIPEEKSTGGRVIEELAGLLDTI
ncbi:MAG: hypothetical protein FJ152_07175 [Firmicutes bacterium]|nr:hypothetical protein [Bacillota bacterium]